jgi:acyl-coenzyme A synthetase/AMP-(fatty) acid ligase
MEAMLADTAVDKFQVAPAELEAILVCHPYVAECVICGLRNERDQTETNYLCHAISRRM